MRSELINKIFSVEKEAEIIVEEAKEKGRELVNQARVASDKALQAAHDKAIAQRDATITEAQQASEQRLKETQETLLNNKEGLDIEQCAAKIAKKMVVLLSTTKLGGRGQWA